MLGVHISVKLITAVACKDTGLRGGDCLSRHCNKLPVSEKDKVQLLLAFHICFSIIYSIPYWMVQAGKVMVNSNGYLKIIMRKKGEIVDRGWGARWVWQESTPGWQGFILSLYPIHSLP